MELSKGMKTVLLVLSSIIFLVSVDACPLNQDVEALLRDAYPKLVLLGFEKGQFTGSKNDEYLAFYEDPRERFGEDSPKVIAKLAVFVIKSNKVIVRYDLEKLNIWSFEYRREIYLDIIKNPQLQFGRWAGYAYVGDYNGNGLEEILFFILAGDAFLPRIIEYNGEEFEITLEFDTPCGFLTEIRTEIRDGRKLLKLYGCEDERTGKGKRDWYLYEWNGKTGRYEIVEEGVE
jgi:hypothetical protein